MKTNNIAAVAAAILFGTIPGFAGNVYVEDTSGSLYSYTPAGVRSTFSTNASEFVVQMAFSPSGTLYAAARDDNAIYAYAPDGSRTAFASVSSPYGLAIDGSGNVYTLAVYTDQIMKYAPNGTASVFSSNSSGPQWLADSPSGQLFGAVSNSIYEYASDGTQTTFASSPDMVIAGLGFDTSGNLYADDWQHSEVLKFTPDGTRSVFAILPSTQLPTGLAYDASSGLLYVGEVANGSSVPGQQVVYAIAGDGTSSVFASGLNYPFGIAVAQSGAVSGAPEPGTWALCGSVLVFGAFGRELVRRVSA